MTHQPEQDAVPNGTPPAPDVAGPAFVEFCNVVARLRAPDGCPWDREQTLETIKPYTLEETYELLEAIDSDDDGAIAEELGDLLLQVVLDCQIARDEARFDIIEVLRGITEKMVRRHPHVFGNEEAETAADVSRHWNKAKDQEKQERESQLDGIPVDLPQLARASRLTKRAARVGYDFPDRNMLFDKLREEMDELAEELFDDGQIPKVAAGVEAERIADEPIDDPQRMTRIESELGDVLFVIANVARRWGVNPEEALRKSNQKFDRRFRYIEQQLKHRDQKIEDASLVEMEEIYQEGKRGESAQD